MVEGAQRAFGARPFDEKIACAFGCMVRRGGRVVEGARLESVYTGNRIAGSNPAPSANFIKISYLLHVFKDFEVNLTYEITHKSATSWLGCVPWRVSQTNISSVLLR